MHKATVALCGEADRLLKPALTGNRTLSGLEEDDLMESAFVRTEKNAQARTERILQVMDGDVTEQFFLEQGQPEQTLSLASLAIEDEDWSILPITRFLLSRTDGSREMIC
jgi:hypothetical protein